MSYAFLPVDLPKIPYSEDQYWQFFNTYARLDDPQLKYNIVRTTNCLKGQSPVTLKYNREKEWWWCDNIINELPELVKFIEQLPIDLTFVQIISNKTFVAPHLDFGRTNYNEPGIDQFIEEQKGLEPTSYRIFLTEAGRDDSLFVIPSNLEKTHPTEYDMKEAIKLIMPNDTDTFLLNTTEYYHGAFLPKKPKLLVFVTGFIKPIEHRELLEKSLKKYE